MMRETSSRSSTSRACTRVLLSIISMAACDVALLDAVDLEHLHPAEDAGHRRAQLVSERGQEVVLGAIGVLRLAIEPRVLHGHGRHLRELREDRFVVRR